MKVKIFTNYNDDLLCAEINAWVNKISGVVIDMKYSNVSDDSGFCFYTVLVMYKD